MSECPTHLIFPVDLPPLTTPWSVPRDWEGETAAILASGPSLTRAQCEAVRGKCRVIAVNNQGVETEVDGVMQPAMAPWADVLFASDLKWWKHYGERAKSFKGIKVTFRPHRGFSDVFSLEHSVTHPTFDPRPTHLVMGGNSGYQAIHLAVHFGVKKIILLGFDMRAANRSKLHWFGNHPKRLDSKPSFANWIRAMDKLAPVLRAKNVDVINCTPNSALRCFRRMSLEAALSGC